MTISEGQAARARYVRTVLAWHNANQTDLASVLGITQPAAGRKLLGKRRFTDDELLAIADAYGLNPANLLRPPELEPLLGAAVRNQGEELVPSTYKQHRRSTHIFGGKRPFANPPVGGLILSAG